MSSLSQALANFFEYTYFSFKHRYDIDYFMNLDPDVQYVKAHPWETKIHHLFRSHAHNKYVRCTP